MFVRRRRRRSEVSSITEQGPLRRLLDVARWTGLTFDCREYRRDRVPDEARAPSWAQREYRLQYVEHVTGQVTKYGCSGIRTWCVT
jgi:hypothetical protein